MKKLEELGISPWPWKMCKHIDKARCVVRNFIGKIIVGYTNNSNARIIAAAPDMYKALYKIVVMLEHCNKIKCCGNCEYYDKCDEIERRLTHNAMSALAKAAGEEVAND